ncbi:hypothetical protein LTR10_006129 [Elasticomyces elasticus]|nr:hypothetical protein LTR10_006129 [Elasticomyces elasticus]KAK4966820.1 hypothetical protein LTR42_011132 [Elasticomyces elasticus]
MADANAIKLEKRYAKRKKPVVRKPAKWCPPPAKRANILMTLPPELRNIIYEDVLARDQNFLFELHTRRYARRSALLFVSKTIRAEASGFYYTGNNFNFVMHLGSLPGLCSKIQRLSEQYRSKPLGSVSIEILNPTWDSMRHGRHLAMLFYRKVELLDRYGSSVGHGDYRLLTCSFKMCREALQTAVKIGKKGADEGWSEEKMEGKLDRFLELASAARTEGSSSKAWKLAMEV